MDQRDPAGPGPGSGALVGRAGELDDIDGLLTSVAGGAGAAALLEGEAGIGRSALLAALVPGARLVAVEPVLVRVDAATVPYGPLRQLVAPRADVWPAGPEDAELAALLAAPDEPPAPRRIAELVATVALRRGAQHPWALLLDDAHLADAATLDVLTRLAHEAPLPGVLVVLTLRPVPHRREVQDLVAAWVRAGARNVELRPLSTPAVQTLVERTVGRTPGPVLRGVLATTGGNPRLVGDVLAAAATTGSLSTSDGTAELTGSDWQAELDARVRRHVAYVDASVRTLLTQASVLGTSFVVPDLAALAALDVTTCWRTLRYALAAGLVAARGDRLAFRHDVVRTALYDDLPAEQRRALHARAAWALEAAGAPSHVITGHLERAR
ncbi:MAG: hypothetical protein BGO38_00640 [Cellulomonas sp. 73-145]|uniref:AAA family ATPase n=1 Tax=Cellulomonas sp. 73-145 TaxID=1895739 RepID=UPI00092A1D38|nr:AAA family ATPase [Cellulomonas sp. 73-145]OJV60094.1 MAG: hypothetical protein BGO38_00640 [Cellulomonas sp. 73-145]